MTLQQNLSALITQNGETDHRFRTASNNLMGAARDSVEKSPVTFPTESQLGPDREIVSAMREHAAMRRHPRIFADIELLPVGIMHELESCDRAFMPARATDAKKRFVRMSFSSPRFRELHETQRGLHETDCGPGQKGG
ncbi:MAG TPA: hypothetical protein VN685_05905 [Rhizomicrobium sp.]|nr:hypothetical protein [Rhizomicrobium sp.]